MTDVYIAGVGMTPFGRHMDKSYKELTAEAVQMALTDAGANKSEVGEAFFASCVIGFLQDQHMVPGQVALRSRGLAPPPPQGCTWPPRLFALAAATSLSPSVRKKCPPMTRRRCLLPSTRLGM